MLQTWKMETAVLIPTHVVFERRASDSYELEESALLATALLRAERQKLPTTTRLWESREQNVYEPGERALLAAPLMVNEGARASPASRVESDATGQVDYVPTIEPEARPVALTQVKFRQVLIEVDDPAVFWDGIIGGQVAAVEEQQPLSGAQIFALFEDAVRDLEFSETWLAGYLLGLSDALLRQRKMYPRTYTALLKALK